MRDHDHDKPKHCNYDPSQIADRANDRVDSEIDKALRELETPDLRPIRHLDVGMALFIFAAGFSLGVAVANYFWMTK
jgi:hypothetical protein